MWETLPPLTTVNLVVPKEYRPLLRFHPSDEATPSLQHPPRAPCKKASFKGEGGDPPPAPVGGRGGGPYGEVEKVSLPLPAVRLCASPLHDGPSSSPPVGHHVKAEMKHPEAAFLAVEEEWFTKFHHKFKEYTILKQRVTEGYLICIERRVDFFLERTFGTTDPNDMVSTVERGLHPVQKTISEQGSRLLQLLLGTSGEGEKPCDPLGSRACRATPVVSPQELRECVGSYRYSRRLPHLDYLQAEKISEENYLKIKENLAIVQLLLHSATTPYDFRYTPGVPDVSKFCIPLHLSFMWGLLLPTVTHVWQEYLTPLMKHQAALKEELGARKELWCSALQPPLLPTSPSLSVSVVGDSLWRRVRKVEQEIEADVTYLETIRESDIQFTKDAEGFLGFLQDCDSRGATITDYPSVDTTGGQVQCEWFYYKGRAPPEKSDLGRPVPVHGLILSHLHRLEIELRSVVELRGKQSEGR